jgi:hypothetical protein
MQISKPKHSTEEFKKAIFLLNTLFTPTARLSKAYFYRDDSGNDGLIKMYCGELDSIIDGLLSSEALSDLGRAYENTPVLSEDSDSHDDQYWKVREDLGKLINKEYMSAGSPVYPLPGKIKEIVDKLSSILQDKHDNKIIEDLYPVNDSLTIYSNGQIEFYSSRENKVKEAKFKVGSSSYKLIRFLAENPNKVFTFDKLAEKINKPGPLNDSLPEMRIRNAVKDIRKKLGLLKEEMFFASYGFSINCKVEIK